MLDKIKNFFKKVSYDTGIKKQNTLIDKINYLLTKNIKVYSGLFRIYETHFLSITIIEHIKLLKHISNLPLKERHMYELVVTNASYHECTISEWCSINNYTIDNIDYYIKEWLSLALICVTIYEEARESYDDNIYLGNSNKLRPYITNIAGIIELMTACVKDANK